MTKYNKSKGEALGLVFLSTKKIVEANKESHRKNTKKIIFNFSCTPLDIFIRKYSVCQIKCTGLVIEMIKKDGKLNKCST